MRYYVLILIVLYSCTTNSNFSINIKKQGNQFVFDKNILKLSNPFSTSINGKRYGVVVDGNIVRFVYPKEYFEEIVWLDNSFYLFTDLDREEDRKSIALETHAFMTSWFLVPFHEESGDMVATIELPNGIYFYGSTDWKYNPAWHHSGPASNSLFIVGKDPKNIEKYQDWEIFWEPKKDLLDYF